MRKSGSALYESNASMECIQLYRIKIHHRDGLSVFGVGCFPPHIVFLIMIDGVVVSQRTIGSDFSYHPPHEGAQYWDSSRALLIALLKVIFRRALSTFYKAARKMWAKDSGQSV